MIQEYRKASAEKCFSNKDIRYLDTIELYEVYYKNEWHNWHPDTDLNQMGMIWDKIKKQGKFLRISVTDEKGLKPIVSFNWWEGTSVSQRLKACLGRGSSLPIAFMKAFMEYLKTQKS